MIFRHCKFATGLIVISTALSPLSGEPPKVKMHLPAALSEDSLDYISSGLYLMLAAGTDAIQPPTPPAFHTAAGRPAGDDVILDPKVGPNTRMGDDPQELLDWPDPNDPDNMHHQAEPHLIRSPTDPGLVVGTFHEGRFSNGGAVNCGYAVSHDGGLTWARALIPGLTEVSGGPYKRATDPVAGIDLDGNIYLQTLVSTSNSGFNGGVLIMSKSTDGGTTFGTPLEIFRPENFGDWFPDKNWMAVNTFPGTFTEGRIVVTHTKFDGGPREIYTQYSDDHGTVWSTPHATTPPDVQGSQPLFLPDGSLVVIYWNFSPSLSSNDSIELVYSTDGGETFGNPVLVAGNLRQYDAPVVRDALFLPSAAVARENGNLHVTYQVRHNGVGRIMFTRSLDKGQTWSTSIPVSDSPNDGPVFNPAISATSDGQHISIIYYDHRNDSNSSNDNSSYLLDLYLAESFDGGTTWNASIRLSDVSSNAHEAVQTNRGRMLGDYQAIAPALGFDNPAVAIWIDTRSGSPDPFGVTIDRTSGTNLDVWKGLLFSTAELSEESISGDFADPDGDGVANIIEYLFGLNPRDFSSNPVTVALAAPGSTLPASAHPAANGGAPVMFSYHRRKATTDIDVGWQRSADVTLWDEETPLAEQSTLDSDPNFETVEASFDPGSSPEAFYRLKVQRAP